MKKPLVFGTALMLMVSVAGVVTAQTADGSIRTESITYTIGDQEFVGFLAYDAASRELRPGVIVVHEWRGIDDYARRRAVDLANEGYVAFALDMYGDGRTVSQAQARTMSGQVGSDFPLIRRRFNAAIEVLRDAPFVDPSRIAAIGYCFGGGIVLNMARMGSTIDGVVSFHGSLNTGLTAGRGDVTTKVLAIQGDQDPVAPAERQQAFIDEMSSADADFSYIIFGNLAAHNFTNPDGRSYHQTEADLAWAAMLSFFDSIF